MSNTPPSTVKGNGGERLWRRVLPSILLVAFVVAAYSNSFEGAFLFDDIYHIVENDRVRQLWPPWELLSVERPVVEFSLAVNYALGGLNPWGYHAFNLVVHILAALTLFGLVRRTITANAECGMVVTLSPPRRTKGLFSRWRCFASLSPALSREGMTPLIPHSQFRIHNSAFTIPHSLSHLRSRCSGRCIPSRPRASPTSSNAARR